MSMFDTTRQRRSALGVPLALACAACTTPPAPPPPLPPPVVTAPVPAPVVRTVYVPTVEPVDQAARHLLAWQDRVAKLQPAELQQEIARMADPAVPANAAPQAQMDLALALVHTRNGGDLARAQGLLDQVLRNPAAADWHALARLLAARLAEQRRAEEQTERLAQQLRETQRDSQRRIEQLNDKLEALKAIERSLNSRGGAASAAAPIKRKP